MAKVKAVEVEVKRFGQVTVFSGSLHYSALVERNVLVTGQSSILRKGKVSTVQGAVIVLLANTQGIKALAGESVLAVDDLEALQLSEYKVPVKVAVKALVEAQAENEVETVGAEGLEALVAELKKC